MAGESWTIMVYQAGDNSLTDECVWALTEMKKAQLGDRIRIFAQFDPEDDNLPAQRFQLPEPSSSRNDHLQIRRSPNGSEELKKSLDYNRIGCTPYWPESNETVSRKEKAKSRRELLKRLPGKMQFGVQAAIKEIKEKKQPRMQAVLEKLAEEFGHFREAIDEFLDLTEDPFPKVIPGLSWDERNHIKDTDSGSPDTLFDFISFCLEQKPRTDRYMLILAGHAGGTEEDYLLRDSSPNSHLTFKQLGRVFDDVLSVYGEEEEFKKRGVIDILGLDACLMSMAEVAYELNPHVDIMIGCESYSPAAGWPYRQILDRLNEELNKKATPQRVAKAIVEEYVNFYTDYAVGGLSVDQSAVDVNQALKLTDRINKLATALEKELRAANKAWRQSFKETLIMAHWEAQSYNGETYVDLYDFCNCLQKRYKGLKKQYQDLPELSNRGNVGGRCRAVMRFIKESYVLKSCFSGPAYQYSYGVSIYFPWSSVSPFYAHLSFGGGESPWGTFLQTYVKETRRSRRKDDGVDSEKAEVVSSISAPTFQKAYRMSSGRMSSGRMSSGRMSSGREGGNPIRSMRNPPVVTFPSRCIDE